MNVASDGEEKFSDDELPASIPRNLLYVDITVIRPTGNHSTSKQHLISRPVARSLENLQRLLKSCLVLSLSVWSVRAGMILLLLLTNSTVPSKHTPKAHPVAVIVVIFV